MIGRVLFFNKVYGFIRSDNHSEDIYFYYKDIIKGDLFKEMFNGDLVEFNEYKEKGRLSAKEVKLIKEHIGDKLIIRVRIFDIIDNKFSLNDFYQDIISKMPIGLKYVFILNNKMIITSEEIDSITANNILLNEDSDKYVIKYI